jgi:hypothetical protein
MRLYSLAAGPGNWNAMMSRLLAWMMNAEATTRSDQFQVMPGGLFSQFAGSFCLWRVIVTSEGIVIKKNSPVGEYTILLHSKIVTPK